MVQCRNAAARHNGHDDLLRERIDGTTGVLRESHHNRRTLSDAALDHKPGL